MPAAPLPANETARLAALRRYDLLDTGSEAEYDDLTKIAAQICATPIALITLVDAQRQWFKSRVGLDATETSREDAFCAYTIHDSNTLIVRDAMADERFADSALVVGEPHIRFYAGAPLQTSEGLNLGSLCVIDRQPRVLSHEQQEALEALARQVVRLIELRSRSRLFQSLVENNPAPMSVNDDAGRYVFVNGRWRERFGRPGEDPLGSTAWDWLGLESGATAFEHDIAVLRSGRTVESLETRPADGNEETWFMLRFPATGIGGETIVGNVSLDVTRTVLAEQRWQDAEHKFARLCEAAPDAIVSGDESGNVVFWNLAASTMFGYTEEEIVGKPWSTLLVPEDRQRFADATRWVRRATRQFTGVRRNGSHFPAEVSLARWEASGRRFRTCFVRDLTERRAIESQLEQARRVESLGQVAATVAHEFNNVLMAIGGFNTIITTVAGHDARVERASSSIERATNRASAIVQQILNYSRANEPVRRVVDLGSFLRTLDAEVRAIAGDGVIVELRLPDEPTPVSCDVQQLEQVLANLVRNACDAMTAGGRLTITLEARDFCADAMLRDGERCARLTVSDTGYGMSEAILARIFEPLFTTKADGTGIGLALARRLIEKHGGVLVATSESGRGSDFVIHLPLVE